MSENISIGSRIGTMLGVQPGEGRQVSLLGSLFAVNVFALLLGRTVRDAVFLNAGYAEYLPWMYVAVAAIVVLSTIVMRRLGGALPPSTLASRSAIFFAITFLMLYVGIESTGFWKAPSIFGLYLWVEVLTSILILLFWTMTNSRFNPRQAKRLYSLITAGQVFGNLACGAVAGLFTHSIGTSRLLWVLSLSLWGSLVLISLVGSGEQAAAGATRKVQTKPRREPILIRQYIISIGMLTVLTYLTTSLVDFQFKVVARSNYSADDLTRFFGIFYGAVGSIAFFLQVFLANRIVRRIGLFGTLSIMPFGFLLLAIGWIFAPALALSRAARTYISPGLKFNENLFRYTLNDPLVQLLFIPLPVSSKNRAQSLMGGILKPLSMGGAGVLMLLLRWFFVETGQIDKILIPVAISIISGSGFWIFLLLRVRRQYIAILAQTTESFRRLSAPESLEFTPERAAAPILEILRSGTTSQKEAALDLAEQYEVPVASGAILDLLTGPKLTESATDTAIWLLLLSNDPPPPENLPQPERPYNEETILLYRLGHGDVLVSSDLSRLLASSDARLFLRLLQLLTGEQKNIAAAASGWLLPRVLDSAADLLVHDPVPELPQFARFLLLLGNTSAFDRAEEQAHLYKETPTAAGRQFLIRFLSCAKDYSGVHKMLSEDPRWFEFLETATSISSELARLALLLQFRDHSEKAVGNLLEQHFHDPLLAKAWQSVATPFASSVACKSRNRKDLVAVEWWSRPCDRKAPLEAQELDDIFDRAVIESDLLMRYPTEHRLLSQSLEDAILRRLALAVRVVAWKTENQHLLRLAGPTPLQTRGRRSNVAEIIDQLWDDTRKAQLTRLLEAENLVAGFQPIPKQQWQDLPFAHSEKVLAGCGGRLNHASGGYDMEIVDTVLALSSVDLFSQLPVQELERIADIAEEVRFESEKAIIIDNTDGDSLFLLTEGTVEVRKNEKTLAKLDQGVCFGEMSLLDNQPRSADVVAISPVTCLRISRDDFAVLLLDQPAISRSIMQVLTGRIRSANEYARSREQSS